MTYNFLCEKRKVRKPFYKFRAIILEKAYPYTFFMEVARQKTSFTDLYPPNFLLSISTLLSLI